MYDELMCRIENLGVVPVVVIKDASKAVPLAKAILKGGINAIEVTFRTDAAEESMELIHQAIPEMILGAGTVITIDQAKKAVDAGAQFIVSPGLDSDIVQWCKENEVPVIPGVCTASEVQKGVKMGLKALKLFPAEASGRVNMIKNLCGPFPQVKFMTTGGISSSNLAEYAACEHVLAAGGSWMVKSNLIEAENLDEITRLCSDAIMKAQGFELIHFGINTNSIDDAKTAASRFEAFGMESKTGNSSTFMDKTIELMHSQFRGIHGHIGYKCFNVERSLEYLSVHGFTPAKDTIKLDEKGRIKVVYLNEEVEGFAIHLVRA